MGKGKRNRERNAQDILQRPVTKTLKKKNKKGMPSWALSLIALAVVILILLPLIISGVTESGIIKRNRVLIKSQTGKFDINQQMATFIAWNGMYESGLYYYQLMQAGYMQDTAGITKTYTAEQYALNSAYASMQENPRDCIDSVLNTLKEYVAVCDLAYTEGVTLAEDDKAQVDRIIEWLDEMRSGTTFSSTNKFLNYTVGEGVREKDVRAVSEIVMLHNKYVEQKEQELDHAITLNPTVLDTYCQENPESFYKMDYLSFALQDKDLAEELKACNTPKAFVEKVLNIHFDLNYKALYNQYTTAEEANKDFNTVKGKTDANENTALSDALDALKIEAAKEYKKDDELASELKDWLLDSKRKQYDTALISSEDAIYLVAFYSAEANADAVNARVKTYALVDGEAHGEDAEFKATLLKVFIENNTDVKEEDKTKYDYKSAATKSEELQKALNTEGADVATLLADALEAKGVTASNTELPKAVVTLATSATNVENKAYIAVSENERYVVYVDAIAEDKSVDIRYVHFEADVFCLILDSLQESIDEDFSSTPATATFTKSPASGSYQSFLFEMKEGEVFESARKNGDTTIVEATKDKVTTYTVYMAVAKNDKMLYINDALAVNGGYLLFSNAASADAALKQLEGKTGTDLSTAFLALTSDKTTNTPVFQQFSRETIDKLDKSVGEWMFDAERKDGDLKVINKTDSEGAITGYYLATFESSDEAWKYTAREGLIAQQKKDWLTALIEQYTVNEKTLNKIGAPSTTVAETTAAATSAN